jgi:hypothetical protein
LKFIVTVFEFRNIVSLAQQNASQQSVQRTGGILRDLQAFSTFGLFPALGVLSRPAPARVTQTVGRLTQPLNNHENIHGIKIQLQVTNGN